MSYNTGANTVQYTQLDIQPDHSHFTNSETDRECRNCHDTGGELIAPCLCTGSVKWVHRECLNDWRAYSPNPKSFSHCDVCGFEYEFRHVEVPNSGRTMKFALRFCRDFFGAMLVVQAVIWLGALLVWQLDRGTHQMLQVFPKTWTPVGVYYVWGLFFFSIMCAIYGAIYLLYKLACGKDNVGRSYSYYDYPYGCGPYYMWWYYPSGYSCAPRGCCTGCGGGTYSGGGDCGSGDCGSGNCGGSSNCGGGGGNNGDGMAILAIVVLVVAIVVGVIVMCVIATIILRRHAHILHKRDEAREQEIVDLSTNPPASSSQIV